MANDEVKKPKKWTPTAIAAFICGILGCSGVLARNWGLIFTLIFSVGAIILGAMAQKEARVTGENIAYARSSFVAGIIFTIVNTIKLIFWIVVLVAFTSRFGGYY